MITPLILFKVDGWVENRVEGTSTNVQSIVNASKYVARTGSSGRCVVS